MKTTIAAFVIVGATLAGCATPASGTAVTPAQLTVAPGYTATPIFTPASTPTASGEPSPTAHPSPSVVPPTPTPVQTPAGTPGPVSPTELAYTVSAVDAATRTIHVRLEIDSLARSRPVLTFWTNAGRWFGDWLDPWTNTASVKATDSLGNSVPVSIVDDGIDWTGDGLRVEAQAGTCVTLEYDAVVGFIDRNFTGDRKQLMAGYMNSDFAVAEPEFVLVAPVDVETGNYVMTLRFELPEGHVSVAHWPRLAQHTYSIDTRDKAFAYGAIAFGNISSQEQTIGQTSVRVAAYGIDDAAFGQMADYTSRLYGYYERAFGPAPIPGFVLVCVPDITDDLYLSPYNEQTGGFFVRYLPWHSTYWSDNIAHPIAHNWIGGGMHGEQWFQEGFVNYYELKSCEAVGLYEHSFVQKELASRLARYEEEIIGTANDLSLRLAADRYDQDHGFPYNFLVYEKGSLLAYLLDLKIAQVSGGQRALDDVIASLWSRHGPGSQQRNIGLSEVQSAVEEVTGQDFSSFFNDYVAGVEPLPLAVEQGEVVLTPDMAR